MLRSFLFACAVVTVLFSQGVAARTTAPARTKIYYSSAPWDGPSYLLAIPLSPTGGAPSPVINIYLWGNPEYPAEKTIQMVAARAVDSTGPGSAVYQVNAGKSPPIALNGTVTFKSLRKGQTVSGAYHLTAADGRVFQGSFEATWGNAPGPGNAARPGR